MIHAKVNGVLVDKSLKFDWFPKWPGETCVIVGGGPSAKDCNLELAKGLTRFIVINNSWELAPWAEVLYACDGRWWTFNKGADFFSGMKITRDKAAAEKYGLRQINVLPNVYSIVTDQIGCVGWGGNGGFHSVNLAVQFGVKKIILVGFDMHVDAGVHWHGKHPPQMQNPTPYNIDRWRQMLDAVKPQMVTLGVKVINASQVSRLQRYPKMSFEEAISDEVANRH